MSSRLKQVTSEFTVFVDGKTRNFVVLLTYSVLSSIFGPTSRSGGGGQYIPLYIVALGGTPAMLGLLRSIERAVRSGLSIPIGWMMDMYNLKKLMLIGMGFQFFSPIVYILVGDVGFHLWWAIPSTIIDALARTLTMYSTFLLIAKSVRDKDRATGYSMRMTFSMIPGLVTPMLWAYIVGNFGGINVSGIRPVFFVMIIGHTISTLWIYLKLDVSNSERLPSPRGKKPPAKKQLLNFVHNLRKTSKIAKGTRRWILISCFDMYCISSIMGFTELFAVKIKGADPFILGLMTVALTASSLLLTIPMGKLGDKIGRKKIMYIGLPPTYAWILLLLYAPAPDYLVVSWIFYGLWWATWSVWSVISIELVPEAHRGKFTGVQGFFTNLVSIPGSLAAGLMWTLFDPTLPFIVALASESIAVILAKTIPETLKKGDQHLS